MTDKELSKANANDGAVAIRGTRFDDQQLRTVATFDDALALLAEEGIAVASADETLGNGFSIIDDKSVLIGVELLLMSWQFNNGDMGEFVSINAVAKYRGVTNAPAKLIINDGSTGIYKQLKELTAQTGKTAGLYVRKGLRVSNYEYEDDKGVKRPAQTFYLDTSA